MKRLFLPIVTSVYLIRLTLGQDWHFTGENVALNKPAAQYPGTSQYMPARKAVDGSTSTLDMYEPEGSCSHTGPSRNNIAYWTVSLNVYTVFKGIRIFNSDPNLGKLHLFQVLGGDHNGDVLYDDGIASPQLFNQTVISIPLSSKIYHNQVTIKVPANNGIYSHDKVYSYMTLCEVQVYAAMQGCLVIEDEHLSWSIKRNSGFLNVSYGLVSVGSVLDLHCGGPGFETLSTSSLSCMQNGSYNRDIPECHEIQCQAPASMDNGHFTHSEKIKYKLGDIISLQCNEGYKPRAPQIRECLRTSTWSGVDLICVLIVCEFPDQFINGTLSLLNGVEFRNGAVASNTIVNITCEDGFVAGTHTARCTLEGVWDIIPSCSCIGCQNQGAADGQRIAATDVLIAASIGAFIVVVFLVVLVLCILRKRSREAKVTKNRPDTRDTLTPDNEDHMSDCLDNGDSVDSKLSREAKVTKNRPDTRDTFTPDNEDHMSDCLDNGDSVDSKL